MSGSNHAPRDLLVITEKAQPDGVLVAVRDLVRASRQNSRAPLRSLLHHQGQRNGNGAVDLPLDHRSAWWTIVGDPQFAPRRGLSTHAARQFRAFVIVRTPIRDPGTEVAANGAAENWRRGRGVGAGPCHDQGRGGGRSHARRRCGGERALLRRGARSRCSRRAAVSEARGDATTCIMPENAMQRGLFEPLCGEYDWDRADAIVAFAKAHRQKVRGHTLVWHSQLPLWRINGVFSPDELRKPMVATSWPRAAATGARTTPGTSRPTVHRLWELAQFNLARSDGSRLCGDRARRPPAPPTTSKLYVNDYNVESPARRCERSTISSPRQARRVPSTASACNRISSPARRRLTLATSCKSSPRSASTPPITELDFRIRLPADDKALAAQADDYASVVRACRETPRCVGVTTWGITDDRSWVPSFFSGYGAALPFDENYRPKPAVAAIIEGFTEKAPTGVGARRSRLDRARGQTGDDIALRHEKHDDRRQNGQGDEGQHKLPGGQYWPW